MNTGVEINKKKKNKACCSSCGATLRSNRTKKAKVRTAAVFEEELLDAPVSDLCYICLMVERDGYGSALNPELGGVLSNVGARGPYIEDDPELVLEVQLMMNPSGRVPPRLAEEE